MAHEVVLATGNPNKLREVQEILGPSLPAGWAVTSLQIELPELQTADTAEIARAKCAEAARRVAAQRGVPTPVIVEDTSLGFEALGGLPGPFIKFFLEKLGPKGLARMLDGFPTRRATALCTFALARGPDNPVRVFEGRCEGTIATAPRGTNNFGWDPVFEPEGGANRTYAEMTPAEKHAVSHRRRALDALCAWVAANPTALCL